MWFTCNYPAVHAGGADHRKGVAGGRVDKEGIEAEVVCGEVERHRGQALGHQLASREAAAGRSATTTPVQAERLPRADGVLACPAARHSKRRW